LLRNKVKKLAQIICIYIIYIVYMMKMVTVLTNGHLKYKVYKRDHNPPHVHVEGGGASLRVNLISLEPMDNKTEFTKSTVKKILLYVARNKDIFLEQWEEYQGE